MSDLEMSAYFVRIPQDPFRRRPLWLLAQQLGWSRAKVRKTMSTIQAAARDLAPLYGYSV